MTAKSITIKAEKNYPKKEEKAFATLLPRPEKRKKERKKQATPKRLSNMGILVFRHLDWPRSRLQQP
jgi:hypothetical protein